MKDVYYFLGVPAFPFLLPMPKAVGLRQVVVLFFSFFVGSPGVFANHLTPTKNRKK
jgi:hypothetical protein